MYSSIYILTSHPALDEPQGSSGGKFKVHEVRMQMLEWQVTLHFMYSSMYRYQCREMQGLH